jgi:hypothetical protein
MDRRLIGGVKHKNCDFLVARSGKGLMPSYFSLLCIKNSYIINKTYEINELQYYILYVHGRYHYVIRDGGPVLKTPVVSATTHDSDVRTRPPDT